MGLSIAALPATSTRVEQHTREEVNDAIRARSDAQLARMEEAEMHDIDARLARLEREWDIERVLQVSEDEPFLEKSSKGDTPILVSDDGKCRLSIIGWIKTVEWLQWYGYAAEPGGVLESGPHQRGSVECLSVTEGELQVEVGEVTEVARAGETLRYRCDRPHSIRNVSQEPAAAMMVCILKAAAMD